MQSHTGFFSNELIIAHKSASEFIMVITAMNHELSMVHEGASELMMAIAAMNDVQHLKKHNYINAFINILHM